MAWDLLGFRFFVKNMILMFGRWISPYMYLFITKCPTKRKKKLIITLIWTCLTQIFWLNYSNFVQEGDIYKYWMVRWTVAPELLWIYDQKHNIRHHLLKSEYGFQSLWQDFINYFCIINDPNKNAIWMFSLKKLVQIFFPFNC